MPVPERFALMRSLGESNAWSTRNLLKLFLEYRTDHLFFTTHVPPFVEAAWHEGRLSDAEWVPHFSAPLTGVVLREFAEQHPETNLTVLCGHTHGAGVFQPCPNLIVYTGGATYGSPELQAVFEDGELVTAASALQRAIQRLS